MYEKQDYLLNLLKKKLENLLEYKLKDNKIKFSQKEIKSSPVNLDFDDKDWKEVKLPFNWDNKKDAWFRKKIIIPKSINGIQIEGSEVKIRGRSYWANPVLNIHTQIFIDGKETLTAKHYMDLSFMQVVSKNAKAGEEHILAIKTHGKEGVVAFYSALPVIEVNYSIINNIAVEIEAFIEEIGFAQSLGKGRDIVEDAIKNVEISDLESSDINVLLETIDQIGKKISILKTEAKKYKIHLIGHAHVDLNWLWPMEETVDVCRDTVNTVTSLMERFPDFRFSQSQAFVYKTLEDNNPDLFIKVREKFISGNWDITASTWVELDLNLSSGESIARQILYAKRYIMEKFNFEPKVCWSPDTFGHPYTMPQILKKGGIDYYYFMRASKRDHELFWWQGLDGSRVMTFNSSYLGRINTKALAELAKYTIKTQKTYTSMFVYGVGDHGGGPTFEDISLINKLKEKVVYPRLEFSTTHNYFNDILKQKLKLPIVNDELNPIFDGCYTSHWDIKLHNRRCEKFIYQAEVAGTISKILGGQYPDLEEPWKITLFNQFHDILPGSAIKVSYDYSNSQAEKAEESALAALERSMSYIKENINPKFEGLPVIVFNSLSWNRTDAVCVEIKPLPKKPVIIKDIADKKYPAQIIDGEILFVAEDVPALGYKVFYVCENDEDIATSVIVDKLNIENDYFLVKIDKNSGVIKYLYDKKNNKKVMDEFTSEGAYPVDTFPLKQESFEGNIYSSIPELNNILQVFYEEPHPMSAWVIGTIGGVENLIRNAEVSVLSKGPVAGIIRVKNKFNKSFINQDIIIYHNIGRIDFNTTIEWNEKAGPEKRSPMLKATFTPKLGKTRALFDIPFGTLERVADGREYPAQKWIDISDKNYGLSLLSDTKYGFSISGNTMSITLIRTSYEPDPDPDRGTQNFIYSIYPHKGDFGRADTVRKGCELNNPLICSVIDKSKSIESKNPLPEQKSFLRIDAPNLVMTCLKKAEDNGDLILRLYESKGMEAEANISFGFKLKNAEEVNLVERKVNKSDVKLMDGKLHFKVKPYEIKTLRLKL